VSLIATASAGYRFGSSSGDASGTSPTMTITMNSDKNVIANFVKIRYTLSTSISSPGSGSISPISGTYDVGIQVTLTATPASGYQFASWSGDASGTAPTVTITMNSDKKVVATFIEETPPEPVEKQFGGVISRNAVLTPENSPFLLTSHVLIPNGVTLVIEPGVIIDLNDKFIQVDGTLQARGEPESPIQFFSSVGSNEGNRILFTEKSTPWSEEQASGCIVEYANLRLHNTGYGVHGPIEIRGASPRIANSSILNLSDLGSAIIVSGGSPIIERNTLEADQIGIQIEHSEARIIGNVIKGAARGLIIRGEFRCQVKQNLIRDNGTGIQLRYLPSHRNDSTVFGALIENTIVSNYYHGIRIEEISDPNLVLPTIRSNSIHDNGEYNVYLESTSVDFDLTGNWWGTTALNTIERGFYHQPQDFRLGRILFEPFLTGPAEEAPTS